MSANEFDRRIAEKLNQAAFTYDPGDWEDLTAKLDAARRKKRAVLLAYTLPGVAASVAILILCTLFFSKKDVPAVAHNLLNKTTITRLPAPIVLSDTFTSPTPKNNIVAAVRNDQRTAAQTRPKANNTQAAIVQNSTATGTQIVNVNEAVADTPRRHTPGKGVVVTGHKPVEMPVTGLPDPHIIAPEPEKKKIHINLAGGVNYGTLNTGYALGATVDRKLGKRLGIEVTVAYINNNSTIAMATGNSTGPPTNITGNPQYSTKVSYTTSPLNYLQFAPVAGYDIFKKVTVAAGADVQRLLQDNDATIVYKDKTVIAPTLDMGVLLKTDYAVNNRLKGGVSYRIGANNLFTSSNYINRSYMQVQLKYRLH